MFFCLPCNECRYPCVLFCSVNIPLFMSMRLLEYAYIETLATQAICLSLYEWSYPCVSLSISFSILYLCLYLVVSEYVCPSVFLCLHVHVCFTYVFCLCLCVLSLHTPVSVFLSLCSHFMPIHSEKYLKLDGTICLFVSFILVCLGLCMYLCILRYHNGLSQSLWR